MTNDEFVIKLYNRKDELIKICKYHNLNDFITNDIIQEMYIKLLLFNNIDKYTKDEEPNMYIIFTILRNLIYDFYKKEKKNITDDIDDHWDLLDEIQVDNYKYEFVLSQIPKVKYWFDRQILDIYINEKHSIRSLSKKTGIGIHIIQPIIHSFKIQCKNNYKE